MIVRIAFGSFAVRLRAVNITRVFTAIVIVRLSVLLQLKVSHSYNVTMSFINFSLKRPYPYITRGI